MNPFEDCQKKKKFSFEVVFFDPESETRGSQKFETKEGAEAHAQYRIRTGYEVKITDLSCEM